MKRVPWFFPVSIVSILTAGMICVAVSTLVRPYRPYTIVCDGNGHFRFTTSNGRLYGWTYPSKKEAEEAMDREIRSVIQAEQDRSRNWKPCP